MDVQLRHLAELYGDDELRHLPTRKAARRTLRECSAMGLPGGFTPTRRSIQRGSFGWEIYVRREVPNVCAPPDSL